MVPVFSRLSGAAVLVVAASLASAQSPAVQKGEGEPAGAPGSSPALGTPRSSVGPGIGPVGATEGAAARTWADDFEVGALVRAFWAYADEDLGGGSVNGFGFHDIDMWAELPIDEYYFRASFEADTGTARLEDAYIRYVRNENLTAIVGSFKPRVLFSNSIDPELLVFNERTLLGTFFDGWDIGIQASGMAVDKLDYYVSITNGSDGPQDDKLYALRGEWCFQGNDVALQEGQRGLSEEQDVDLGVVFFQDTGDNAVGFGVDVLARFEKFCLQGEAMSLDDGLGGNVGLKTVPVSLDGDSLPWAISGSTMLSDNMQVAGRFQSADNDDGTRVISVALDYFPEAGPIFFVAQVDRYDEDGDNDGFVLQLGASMGRTRNR
jgi:hypothetical protein